MSRKSPAVAREETEWVARDINMLIKLWSDGLPLDTICVRMARTKGSIMGKRDRLQLPLRQPPKNRRSDGSNE
jgi:hypothetical protein